MRTNLFKDHLLNGTWEELFLSIGIVMPKYMCPTKFLEKFCERGSLNLLDELSEDYDDDCLLELFDSSAIYILL